MSDSKVMHWPTPTGGSMCGLTRDREVMIFDARTIAVEQLTCIECAEALRRWSENYRSRCPDDARAAIAIACDRLGVSPSSR